MYVTVAFHGRYGNWMYSYASLLGIARANGYIPYLTASHPLTNVFALTKIKPRNVECLHTVYDDLPCTYNPKFMNLPPGNISIEGYIQSWKYFKFVEEEVRKEFKFHDNLKIRAEFEYKRLVGKYLQDGHPIISIHVRRGDVLRPAARKLGFSHAPWSYIDNAMKYMLQRFPNAVFLVASDDIIWCQTNIVAPDLSYVFNSSKALGKITLRMTQDKLQDKIPIVFSGTDDDSLDFAMLTFCNHSIVTVGTFGWWSAWLANGHVVYYKDVPLPHTKLEYEMKKEDFFPEHWVGLSGVAETRYSYFCEHNLCNIFLFLVSVLISSVIVY